MQTSSSKLQKTNQRSFDLEERASLFGIEVIKLCKQMSYSPVTKPLVSQIVRSSTSIGANYAEANNAASKKDFRNKLYIAKKEAQETKHWLKMLAVAEPSFHEQITLLLKENHEICLILQSIANKVGDGNE